MITCMVAIFVKDRYGHTKLCCDWLLNSKDVSDVDFTFFAYDDDSQDPEVVDYMKDAFGNNVVQFHSRGTDPGRRLAHARKSAVAAFEFFDYDYLLLLDNDILLTRATIAEAIKDYELLAKKEDCNIGGYTLHPLGHIENRREINGFEFSTISLTGDAHMLFRRDHLEHIGNHFSSSKEGGFADTQIHAIIESGHVYMSRTCPSYQIQHLGFGVDASLCYKDKAFAPFWTARPYWTHSKDRTVIQVEGFDVLLYAKLVNSVGGRLAPTRYLRIKGVR